MSRPRSNALRAPGPAFAAALAVGGVAVAVFPPGLNPFGPVKLVVTMTIATLACVSLAFDADARARLHGVLRSPLALSSVALGAVSVLSLVASSDVRLVLTGAYPSYTGFASVCAWAAFGLTTAAAPVADARRLIGRGAVLALFAAGAYALIQRLGFDPMPASAAFDAGRSASFLGNAANLGAYVALSIPLAGDRTLADGSRVWRVAAGAALVLGALAAGFSGSRGALLGVIFGLCAWFALSFATDRAAGRRVAGAAFAIALVLAASVLLTPVAAERMTGGGTASATASGRLAVWRSTLPMIAERPVLGWGPSGYGRAHTAFATAAEVDPRGRVEALDDPHNIVLSAAVSGGVPGVLALLAFVGFALAEVWRARRGAHGAWAAALGAGLIGISIALQFHFVTLDTGAALAVLVGAIGGLGVADAAPAPAVARPSLARAWWVAAAIFCVMALLGTGVVVADAHVRAGFAAAEAGEWSRASEQFASARSLAPLSPEFAWAEGRAATDALTSGAPDALADGVAAFRAAESRMSGDSRVPRDLGDLFIAGAVTSGSPSLWTDALSAYKRALALAPTDPRAWLGKGVAEAGSGDLSSAIRDIGRATELSPRFADAWENLAAVYDARGETASAAAARAKAAAARE